MKWQLLSSCFVIKRIARNEVKTKSRCYIHLSCDINHSSSHSCLLTRLDKITNFFFPDEFTQVDLGRCEQMRDAELPNPAPVVPIFGESNALVAIGHELSSFRGGPVCEDDVVRFEYLFGEGRGGDEDGGDGA